MNTARVTGAILALTAIVGTAQAAPTLLNGGFEFTTSPYSQFQISGAGGDAVRFGTVNNWESQSNTSAGHNVYNVLFNGANASLAPATTQFGGAEYLGAVTPVTASPNGGNFVALDADNTVNGTLSQLVTGLVAGESYAVKFFWAASQYASRTGATTEELSVKLGSSPYQTTNTVNTPTGGFVPWMAASFTFVASSTSELLSFLATGTPTGLPPVVLLDGVSVTQVPEPMTLSLLGAGLLGLGVARFRRRA